MRTDLLCRLFHTSCLLRLESWGLMEVSTFNWKARWTKKKGKALFLLFHRGWSFFPNYFPLAGPSICTNHIFFAKRSVGFQKKKMHASVKFNFKGLVHKKRPTRGSRRADREWLIAFFLAENPIHAKQKPYSVSIMVWLYYCAFHEIHLKGGVSLAHSRRWKERRKKNLPAAVLWSRTTLAVRAGNNQQDACEP